MEIKNRKTGKTYIVTPDEWQAIKAKNLSGKYIIIDDKEFKPERRIIPHDIMSEEKQKQRRKPIKKITEIELKNKEDERIIN